MSGVLKILILYFPVFQFRTPESGLISKCSGSGSLSSFLNGRTNQISVKML
jgi:hypothetical protein